LIEREFGIFCLKLKNFQKMKRFIQKFVLLLAVGLIFFCGSKTWAQQMPLYSQYMMNGFILNPAVAGGDGFTTVALSSRDHMMGFENSPKTYVISAQTRLMRTNYRIKNLPLTKRKIDIKRSGRVGIGASIYNDRNGYIERTGGQFTYAYHIYKRMVQYSFGLSLSTFQFKISTQHLQFRSQEPLFDQSFSNKMLIPDASVGIYVLSPNYFGGFSVANLFQTRIRIGSETYDYRMYRHYFLMTGYRFKAEELYSYEPSCLVKATEQGVIQADIQMRAYYSKDYYLGLSYRSGSAVGLLIGARWKRLFIGYAFDYSLTPLQQYSLGAHEINLALKLGDNTRRYNWLIRY
jgi:type IX secretion system PorP/SprF family membrane protein